MWTSSASSGAPTRSSNSDGTATVTPTHDTSRGFDELPINSLDPSDRKFLAVAVVAEASILNAADSDWNDHRELLAELAVSVKQLCPAYAVRQRVPGWVREGDVREEYKEEVVLANSPQAKGRVERTFGTAQDRLIKEMRLARVATIEAANRYLVEQWMPFRNERFAVAPADPLSARPGSRVVVERCLSGELRFRHRDRYLAPQALGTTRPAAPAPEPAKATAKPRPKPPTPGRDHPWRKHFRASAARADTSTKRRSAAS